MYQDLSYMKIPLPEDVLKLKNYGDFAGAQKMIDHFMTKDIPNALRKRLEIEKDVLKVMGGNEYPYTYEEALEIMTSHLRDFKEEELQYLKEISAADWIYVDGTVHFQRRFYENLIKTRPDLAERVMVEDVDDAQANELKQKLLNDNVHYMKEKGGRTVRTQIRATIKAQKDAEEVGRKVTVHLPIPKICQQVSKVDIIAASPEITKIADEDAAQRTVCFETELKADQEFMVEYAYDYHVDYVELDPAKASEEQPDFCTNEQAPHIRFTPYLQELLKEIIGDETNPIIKARKIYDFVTTKVMYSYMREYFTIECIPEYAAINLKGDCGVQALLFITLCRMTGIPARWQSGLYATEFYTGCHDWAQFYVAPYGWVFADLSFGGSAWRMGNTERWNYYFGNLDIFRMPANSEIQMEFTPEKKWLRIDPIDNQRGEIEYEDHGLSFDQVEVEQILVSMEDK
ncbi:transglutaminase-like domain-containing protein [Frisingicoccus sp.]|uniref:transglutaminase-like domain-containing protein n=2 Tax=Frisingicoccus sp. TaxID=1918627 RepID=UPI002E7A0150|nr:transglutaminase-like domain-containing protein [Frisingicoccus sp.]MEE0753269.1 transglutaminase-like domain-containing protein [Frisingicoccus sp.]